jgi:hypothetical protein
VTSDDGKPSPPSDNETLALWEFAYLKANSRTKYGLLIGCRMPAFRLSHARCFRKRASNEWMADGGTRENWDGGIDG